jgi:two-component system, chemotaxis family, chemotaxis protein CheY
MPTRILVVDDALFMRKLIRDALDPYGFTIVGEAENGQQGVAMFRDLKPDIVTLDIVMPEMDGLQALAALKQENRDARVIMITALEQRDLMLEAVRLGATDFIVKPFSEDRVLSAIEKALGRGTQKVH